VLSEVGSTVAQTLGQYLMSLRLAKKLTLREVEERSKKAVSNAYLSQIENDKIKQPSPNILHVLAMLYGIEYQKLMEMAGYVGAGSTRAKVVRDRGVLIGYGVTAEEEVQLAQYLRFLRSSKRRI
jgi:HTH-type transcriptional regulator, competence development regulator